MDFCLDHNKYEQYVKTLTQGNYFWESWLNLIGRHHCGSQLTNHEANMCRRQAVSHIQMEIDWVGVLVQWVGYLLCMQLT